MKAILNKGFTVVELAVVIDVIAVLATIGVVAYRGATESSDDGKMQAEYNDIRNAIELYEARNGVFPACPSSAECNLSQITSQPGIDGIQTMAENNTTIRYISTNTSPKSWAIRMYSTQTGEYCKMGNNIRSNWWSGHSYCWQ